MDWFYFTLKNVISGNFQPNLSKKKIDKKEPGPHNILISNWIYALIS